MASKTLDGCTTLGGHAMRNNGNAFAQNWTKLKSALSEPPSAGDVALSSEKHLNLVALAWHQSIGNLVFPRDRGWLHMRTSDFQSGRHHIYPPPLRASVGCPEQVAVHSRVP